MDSMNAAWLIILTCENLPGSRQPAAAVRA
jgi:hypothetical protein